jgi:hypothetical protein
MGWFSSDDNDSTAPTEKQNLNALKWLKKKMDDYNRREAERIEKERKDIEKGVRDALGEEKKK